MARNHDYGRQTANVQAGDYRSYKRIIEERRRNNAENEDTARRSGYSPARNCDDSRSDDYNEVDQAAAEAYARSADDNAAELDEALGTCAADYEDEADMSAPRRRARSYRAGQPPVHKSEPETEREPPSDAQPEREAPVEARPPVRRPVRKNADRRPERAPARPPRARADSDEADEEPLESARTERSKRAARQMERAMRHDASSHEVDDLEDYESGDTSYNDDVYEPYEYEEDMELYDDADESATEWSDGIKRVLKRGRDSLRALSAKKHAKKRPSKPKRPASGRGKRLASDEQNAAEAYGALPVAQTAENGNSDIDMKTYDDVSQEIEAMEETPVLSRRERRLMHERAAEEEQGDEFPQTNIVSCKAMRAAKEELAQEEAEQQAQIRQEDAGQADAPAEDAFVPPEPAETPAVQPQNDAPTPAADTAASEAEMPLQPVHTDDGAETDIIFGIQGRTGAGMMGAQTVGVAAPEGKPDESPKTFDWNEVMPDENRRMAFDGGISMAAAQPEPEPEPEAKPHKLSRRERKAARKAAKARQNTVHYRDPSDDDDDNTDYVPVEYADADGAVPDETASYERQTLESADVCLGDDDDEPEEDGVAKADSDMSVSRKLRAEYGFDNNDNENADDAGGESEDDGEMYGEGEDEARKGHGGCLKAFTIFLVALVVLFGSVWALDYFNVINLRRIASDVASMPVFAPLRGNILPSASQTPRAASAPAASPVPTIQPADKKPDAQPSSGIQPEASALPAASPAAIAQQDNMPNASAAAPFDAAAAVNAGILRTDTSGRGEFRRNVKLRAEPIEAALPDNSHFDLHYSVYDDYEYAHDYRREVPIAFGTGSEYTDLEGVITFRGNNFRENAAYGSAALSEKKFKVMWKNRIGSIDSGYAVWSGVGWNGQPVMVHWSDEMRNMMNIADSFKADSELVEVIYGTLDGNIYFLDARTGDYTRDPIRLGFPIKGSVSIDPRGYPLLYVGQGISKANGKVGSIGWRVYNLLNQEHMYLLNGHDELKYRKHGSFDGVCLLNAATDTIIEGAENGMFYTIKLNTTFDPAAPSISIAPKVALYRYKSRISDELGIENSVAAYGQYAYFVDNSGLLTCLDLNAMKPAWLFDAGDDTDASIALEPQPDGTLALYTANEIDKQGAQGLSTLRKLNALTGEELWNYSVKCKSDGNNGGGAFASPALGKNSLSELVYFNICRTEGGGTLYAFNKQTGEIVWKQSTGRYSWSSPVIVYDETGNGVVILGNSGGVLRMYDGLTGEVYDEIEIDGNMEGSPAVYNDMLVIGTRDMNIYGIKIL